MTAFLSPAIRSFKPIENMLEIELEFGYPLSKTGEAIEKALGQADELASQVEKLGEQTGVWARRMVEKVKALNIVDETMNFDSGKSTRDYEKASWELTCFENEIMHKLGAYINGSSKIVNQLKSMNPPLNSDHLNSILKRAESSRAATFKVINPLLRFLGNLKSMQSYNPEDSCRMFLYSGGC